MSNTTEDFLVISSNDRDTTAYPKVCQYSINLDKKFRKVKTVQLVHSILPKQGTILSHPYLLLHIEEFKNSLYSNDQNISKCFQILPVNNIVSGYDYINFDSRKNQESIVYYIPAPKERLQRLTIKITDLDGNLFDFGAPDGDTTKTYRNTFMFKIISEAKEF